MAGNFYLMFTQSIYEKKTYLNNLYLLIICMLILYVINYKV